MGLIEDCEIYFGCKDLYDVLAIQKNATAAEIKKAYRKLSLFVHPDRATPDKKEEATRKFQILAKVHFILSDPDKRGAYDEVGLIDEENVLSEDSGSSEFWQQYWRNLFPKISTKDIDNFLDKYKGSEDEIRDLKECYCKCDGDMNLISEHFIAYAPEEEERITGILKDLINKDEIPSFPKFVNESKLKKQKRMKRFKSEVKEAEKAKEDADSALAYAMTKRREERESNFDSMIANLTAKYCTKKPKGKGKVK